MAHFVFRANNGQYAVSRTGMPTKDLAKARVFTTRQSAGNAAFSQHLRGEVVEVTLTEVPAT